MVKHRHLPSSERHEPSGISLAEEGDVYVADGQGSGAWGKFTPDNSMLSVLHASGTSAYQNTADKNTEAPLQFDPLTVLTKGPYLSFEGNKIKTGRNGFLRIIAETRFVQTSGDRGHVYVFAKYKGFPVSFSGSYNTLGTVDWRTSKSFASVYTDRILPVSEGGEIELFWVQRVGPEGSAQPTVQSDALENEIPFANITCILY